MIECSFATACLKFFGMLPGQNLSGFQAELKTLTDKDRAELTAMFATVGYKIVKPQ